MADITIVPADVGILNPLSAVLHKLPAGSASLKAGDLVRLDTSTGKVVWCDGSDAAGSRVLGILINTPTAANDTVTVVERGQIGLGTALDSETIDADVYLSDVNSEGNMTTTLSEGTSAVKVGRIFPFWHGNTLKKVLDFDASLMRLGIVSQATAEAGTSTIAYLWTPQRIAQAIAALESA